MPSQVRNPAARRGGLDISLFRRLSDAHPHAVVDLVYQYRMNAEIMLLSNKLIYGDRLRCGSEEVAQQSLVLPNTAFLRRLHAGGSPCHPDGCWIDRLASDRYKFGTFSALSLSDLFHLTAAKPSLLTPMLFLLPTLEWAILCKTQSRPNLFVRLRRPFCEVAYAKTRLALFRCIGNKSSSSLLSFRTGRR
jgi:hypothetical protein